MLGFLWLFDESSTLWSRIILAGWLIRSVTMAALILRFVTFAQAMVTGSMVAVALLHYSHTPLSSVPAVSIAQFVNTGPRSLIPHLPKRMSAFTMLAWLLVVGMTVTSSSLQFTSTALLSDIDLAPVNTTQLASGLPYGIRWGSFNSEELGWFRQEPRAFRFPAFAEHSEPSDGRDGVWDTGLSMRAFLPIISQPKPEDITKYTGIATVVDTRVACMRPSLADVQIQLAPGLPSGRWNSIWGSVWTELSVPGMNSSFEAATPVPFNCTFAQAVIGAPGGDEWAVTVCGVNFGAVGMLSKMRPNFEPIGYTPPVGPGAMYLVINTTRTQFAPDFTPADVPVYNLTLSQPSETWMNAFHNGYGIFFNATLCTLDPAAVPIDITASRSSTAAEPSATWLMARSRFDTTAIRASLGATQPPLSRASRAIFNLTLPASLAPPLAPNFILHNGIISLTANSTLPFWLGVLAAGELPFAAPIGLEFNAESFVRFCTNCEYGIPTSATNIKERRSVLTDLFQDTLRDTGGNVAVALQAVLTGTAATLYYEYGGLFDATAAEVAIQSTALAQRPVRRTFAMVVLALLGAHLVLVAAGCVLFALTPGDRILGGAWAAVAQLRGPEVERWFSVASINGETMRDWAVTKRMRDVGEGGIAVGVGDVQGRLSVVRRRKRGKGRKEEWNA
jgi:hypothetical protein